MNSLFTPVLASLRDADGFGSCSGGGATLNHRLITNAPPGIRGRTQRSRQAGGVRAGRVNDSVNVVRGKTAESFKTEDRQRLQAISTDLLMLVLKTIDDTGDLTEVAGRQQCSLVGPGLPNQIGRSDISVR
ncbi:MAG: hypothetical protein ACKVHE_11405 [Planctomycetales bacterium]